MTGRRGSIWTLGMASRAEAWYQKRLDSGGDAADSSGLAMAFYLQERWSESRALFAALGATGLVAFRAGYLVNVAAPATCITRS